MKKFLSFLFLLVWLVGCSGGPPIPDWTLASFNRLEDFKKNYLEGHQHIADLQFQKAVAEIKKSGDLEVLAKAYLTRMAVESAVLETPQDEEFIKINAAQSHPVHQNYHAFLTGQLNRVQEQLLPEVYRTVAKGLQQGKTDSLAADVARIDDPLSRLIASAVCIKQGRVNEAILQTAIDTASRNGWKKALLVYLEKLHAFYQERGQEEKADAISKRIQLIRS